MGKQMKTRTKVCTKSRTMRVGRKQRKRLTKEQIVKRLQNQKVGKKLQLSFGAIMVMYIFAIAIAVVGIALINNRMTTFYQESYANNEYQMEIRKDVQVVGKNVLWAITMDDAAKAKEKITTATEYTQNVADNIAKLEENSTNEELLERLDTAAQNLKTAGDAVVKLASQGENIQALVLFNGTYNTATDELQNVLLEIGKYTDGNAKEQYILAKTLGIVIEILVLLIGILTLGVCVIFVRAITKSIGEPIKELEMAAEKLKTGELDIIIDYVSEDEMGGLAENFRQACMQMHDVIEDAGCILNEMAEGNFDVNTTQDDKYVGKFRLLIDSMSRLFFQMNETLHRINDASNQVAIGARQLAENAQDLAEGATEQSGAVEELTATVENISSIAEESATNAGLVAEKVSASEREAKKSREEMVALTAAMEHISTTSKEIENIIGAIEEIASQTNLLSLNASIEAARAGEAGRGFAVVADQIGKLALDSAKSAVSTRKLIEKSLVEIENGNQITRRTSEVIGNVLTSMIEFAHLAEASLKSSRTQADMLKQMEVGIEQIATVVERNSAAAEETSAVSEELNAQAETLKDMLAKFRLREL